jgi:hypothetical protein
MGSNSSRKFIFTITPGHTGTTFLAKFLSENIPNSEIHHEILGYDKFGVDTPDLSHMTLFNSQGNVDKVKAFWDQKIERVLASSSTTYGEISHLLAKAGLIENITPLFEYGEVYIINLKRDIEKIILSLAKRSDFLNKGNMWLWHLDPDYPGKLVDPDIYRAFGVAGIRYWYVCEMYARAEYYRQISSDNSKIHFIDLDIDDLSSPEKSADLLSQLNSDINIDNIVYPEKKNVSRGETDEKERIFVRNMLKRIRFNAEDIASNVISNLGKQSLWAK